MSKFNRALAQEVSDKGTKMVLGMGGAAWKYALPFWMEAIDADPSYVVPYFNIGKALADSYPQSIEKPRLFLTTALEIAVRPESGSFREVALVKEQAPKLLDYVNGRKEILTATALQKMEPIDEADPHIISLRRALALLATR